MNKFTLRHWGIFFTVISTAVLAAVYYSQYVLKMAPCHLCLMQRIPFYVALALGILLTITANEKNIAKILLGLLAVTFICSTALAIFHFGVEQKWWTYNSACTGQSAFKPGASVAEMMAALKAAPTVRCDQIVPFLFGMSMAFYNILTSAGLSVLAIIAICKKNSSS